MNGVITTRMKRMTLTKTLDRQPEASPHPVPFERLDRIVGAGGAKTADRRRQPGKPLIEMDQDNEEPCHRPPSFSGSLPATTAWSEGESSGGTVPAPGSSTRAQRPLR